MRKSMLSTKITDITGHDMGVFYIFFRCNKKEKSITPQQADGV